MKKSIRSILVLGCICAVVSVVLAITNSVTSPIILKNDQQNANAALYEVLPDGGSFTLADISVSELPGTVNEVYKAENGGYVIKLTTTGYAPDMVIMCGISADSTVVNTKIISSGETPSIGGTAAGTFAAAAVGTDLSEIDAIDTIAGATKTTAAYRNAIKDALNTVVILGGGSVDLRTEEEILNDNLSAALPAADGKFTKHFFVEVVEGIDAIYTADNNAGAVCVIEDKFIGIDSASNITGECDEATAQLVKSAIDIISATETTALDLASYSDLPSQLVAAEVTATGNYIIDIKGAGYGITGGDEYHPASGEYIMIRVSMTSDGKIIDCLTVSEEETDGFGSACADESFYGQFDGKTEADYTEIDGISGATLTTDGYKKAILRAFNCVKIFEEGNN